MGGSKKQQRLSGRESVTEFLRLLDSASIEAGEMFELWARRRPHRLEPDERLAEERYWEEVAFRKRAQYLRRKKLIRTKKTEKGLLLELTDQGREELIKRLVKERPSLPDGRVCLVLYDIPLDAGSGRDALRYFLKRIGFIRLQQSVWQTDKDVVEEVLEFVRSAKIQRWVQVYLGKKKG